MIPNGTVAVLLFGLTAFLLVEAARAVKRPREAAAPAARAAA